MARRRPEERLWDIIRSCLPRGVIGRRIEDASGNLGTPDVFVAWGGMARSRSPCGWIELKVAGPNAKPILRPGQQATMTAFHHHGVPCAYLVGSDRGPVRMVGPLTDGDDWREHLIERWPEPNLSQMTSFLRLMWM